MDQTSSSDLWDEYKILHAENQNLGQRMINMQECIERLEEERNIVKTENARLRSQITEKDNQIGNYVDRLHQISMELSATKVEKPNNDNHKLHLQLRYAEEMNAELLHSVVELTKKTEGLAEQGAKMDRMLEEVERRYQKQTETLHMVLSDKRDLEEQLSYSFNAPIKIDFFIILNCFTYIYTN